MEVQNGHPWPDYSRSRFAVASTAASIDTRSGLESGPAFHGQAFVFAIIPDRRFVNHSGKAKRTRNLRAQSGLPALAFHKSRFERSIHSRFD
ncbi:MAG TPA: hypothetical protein VJ862_00660 [Rhodanobacteraceae bacterium]|nr:hypothetical protein [Rhodanobacteraceae bacterium]